MSHETETEKRASCQSKRNRFGVGTICQGLACFFPWQPTRRYRRKALLIAMACLGCGHERAHSSKGDGSTTAASPAASNLAAASQANALGTSSPPASIIDGERESAHASTPTDASRLIAPTSRVLALTPGSRSARGKSAMVVSVSPEATRVGLSVLDAGGNAVDAAVAVAFTLAVTHPSAGNLGGGGFALVHLDGGSVLALDFRESSPRKLDRSRFFEMIRNGGEGADSVAIPGSVAGLYELSSRYGKLPFAQLVAPARTLAEQGHRVSHREATAIRSAWPKLKRQPWLSKLYGTPQGQPLPQGFWLRLPRLAQTLKALETGGAEGFYSGPIAGSLVRSLGLNAQISLNDLRDYRAIWRQPLVVPYNEVRVVVMPPPSAGGIALATSLAMLSRYDARLIEQGSAAHAHLLLEIMRRAQADRIYSVVDPDSLGAAERTSKLSRLLDPERWLKRFPIDPLRVTPNEQIVAHVSRLRESEDTTHLAVVDGTGLAVSLTTTLSAGFGAKVITDTGIVLNNALASFSDAGENQPLPNRRTTSSMAPTFVQDRQGLRLVLGTPGGDTIPSTLLLLLNALLDYAVPLDSAINAPRLHQDVGSLGLARTEGRHPILPELQRRLERMGHRFCHPTPAMGHANTIAIIDGYLYGYADPREGGLALGRGDEIRSTRVPLKRTENVPLGNERGN